MTPLHSRASLPVPTPQQQKVLDRILVQRERRRARSAAMRQAQPLAATQERVEPDAPLVARLITFARLHPVAVVAVAGVALALAGPNRVIRWAGLLVPLLVRMRRG